MQHYHDRPLVRLAAYRDPRGLRGAAAAGYRRHLAQSKRHVRLGPLAADAVRDLVADRAPGGNQHADDVAAVAHGHPALIAELLHGHLCMGLTAGDVIAGALSRLSPPTRTALRCGAVLREVFLIDELAELTGLRGPALEQCIAEGTDAALVLTPLARRPLPRSGDPRGSRGNGALRAEAHPDPARGRCHAGSWSPARGRRRVAGGGGRARRSPSPLHPPRRDLSVEGHRSAAGGVRSVPAPSRSIPQPAATRSSPVVSLTCFGGAGARHRRATSPASSLPSEIRSPRRRLHSPSSDGRRTISALPHPRMWRTPETACRSRCAPGCSLVARCPRQSGGTRTAPPPPCAAPGPRTGDVDDVVAAVTTEIAIVAQNHRDDIAQASGAMERAGALIDDRPGLTDELAALAFWRCVMLTVDDRLAESLEQCDEFIARLDRAGHGGEARVWRCLRTSILCELGRLGQAAGEASTFLAPTTPETEATGGLATWMWLIRARVARHVGDTHSCELAAQTANRHHGVVTPAQSPAADLTLLRFHLRRGELTDARTIVADLQRRAARGSSDPVAAGRRPPGRGDDARRPVRPDPGRRTARRKRATSCGGVLPGGPRTTVGPQSTRAGGRAP